MMLLLLDARTRRQIELHPAPAIVGEEVHLVDGEPVVSGAVAFIHMNRKKRKRKKNRKEQRSELSRS